MNIITPIRWEGLATSPKCVQVGFDGAVRGCGVTRDSEPAGTWPAQPAATTENDSCSAYCMRIFLLNSADSERRLVQASRGSTAHDAASLPRLATASFQEKLQPDGAQGRTRPADSLLLRDAGSELEPELTLVRRNLAPLSLCGGMLQSLWLACSTGQWQCQFALCQYVQHVSRICRRESLSYLPIPYLQVFGEALTTAGFPPWLIRVSEIYRLGSLRDATPPRLAAMLQAYSHVTQRFGS